METQEIEYYDSYEKKLLEDMMKMCMLPDMLPSSEDIDNKWNEIAPEYMADAVPQINTFPEAAIAWAGYVGMALANRWDSNWKKYSKEPYSSLYGERGFDDMDEHIVRDILGFSLDSKEAMGISATMLSCAQMAMNRIMHEQIESQSVKAFHILARTVRVLFRIGAAIELQRLGYRYQKVRLDPKSLVS